MGLGVLGKEWIEVALEGSLKKVHACQGREMEE